MEPLRRPRPSLGECANTILICLRLVPYIFWAVSNPPHWWRIAVDSQLSTSFVRCLQVSFDPFELQVLHSHVFLKMARPVWHTILRIVVIDFGARRFLPDRGGAAYSSPLHSVPTCMRTGSAKNLMTRGIRKYGTVRYCSISSQSRDRRRSPKSGRLCITAGKRAERKEEEFEKENTHAIQV